MGMRLTLIGLYAGAGAVILGLLVSAVSHAKLDDGDANTQSPTATQSQNSGNLIIKNPSLAAQNWTLNCQGCHKAGAVGLGTDMPNLNGNISRFLKVDGGQEFLSQINGITNAPLSDEDLADLVNWMLLTYDPANIPENFTGFDAKTLGELRKRPLDHTIIEQRKRLMDKIIAQEKAGLEP